MVRFKYDSLSYVGRRQNNQDACFAGEISTGFYFLAVADGMGGVAGGEIASQTVIASAKSVLHNESKTNINPDNLKVILSQIFEKAQEELASKIEQEPALTGMGTTLTCVLLLDDKYVWGNIGDSRIYLVSENDIKQLTNDHTYVQEHINKHEDDIPEHFYKTYGHIITRSINGETDKPDLYPIDANYKILNDGELFLLCSDGLISNKIEKDNSDYYNMIVGNKDLTKTCKNLISFAYIKGSTDNITVVLGEYGDLKRKKVSIPEYEYPPKKEQTIENNNYSSDSSRYTIENSSIVKNNYANLNKHNPERKLSKIVLISIIILLTVFGGGYLLLKKKSNNEANTITSNSKEPNEQKKIKEVNFKGFEDTKRKINKENESKKSNIGWSIYPDANGFMSYIISEKNEGIVDYKESKNKRTITSLFELGIENKGIYNLTIKVKLQNGKIIPGEKELVLTVY